MTDEPPDGPAPEPRYDPAQVVYCAATGKVRHPSRKVALTNLRRTLRGLDGAGRDRKEMGHLTVYRCDKCNGGWHRGNKDRFDLKARKKRGGGGRNEWDEEAA